MQSVGLSKPSQPWAPKRPGWRWWVNVWVPVVFACAVIATESTATFSADNTSGWLRPLCERIFGHIADATWDPLHHYIRKTGHFVGYGLVALSFLRAWLHTLIRDRPKPLLTWRLESSILAVLSTAIVASLDEFHQTMIPSRTGLPSDVLLDTCGATAMCLLIWLTCWLRPTSRAEHRSDHTK